MDIDGDGKPDLVTFNNFSVNVFLNTTGTAGGDITFAGKYPLDFPAGTNSHQHYGAVVSDIDGDGKPDIAFVNNTASRLLIYRNLSTTGNISFSAATVYTGFSGALALTSGDFNGDGKTDLAVVNGSTVKFLKNISTVGNIDLQEEGTPVTTGSGPFHISSADFDGDGKVDLAVSNSTSNTVSFFRNTFAGNASTDPIAFSNGLQVAAGTNPQGMALGDLDGDGVMDIALLNGGTSGVISFMRNISSSGNISFTRTTLTPSGAVNLAGRIALTDLDGDNKVDVIAGSAASAIYCFKNTSPTTGGTITFNNTPVAVATGVANGQPVGVCAGDFNNDARPDLGAVNAGSANVDVFINKISKVVVNNMTPVTGTQGTDITLIGTGLGCVDKATIGGVSAIFGSADENTVKITAGAGNTGNVLLYTAGTGSQYLGPKFTFVVAPTNLSYAVKSADTTISVTYGTESFTNSPVLNDGGGGVVFTIESGAVAGININANTGQIGWISTLAVGEYRLKVKAENSAGSVSAFMTLKVVPDVPKDLAYFSNPYGAIYASAGSTGTTTSGDVWVDWKGQTGTFSISALSPASPGITINPANGQVTWSSSVAVGLYTIVVAATNDAGEVKTTIELKVSPQVPTNLSYPAPNPLTIKYGNIGGVNMSSAMSWHGEAGTFALTSTGLPSGFTLNTNTGRITWNNSIPVGGPYVLRVTATNTAGTSAPATFTLNVEAEAPTDLTYASPVLGNFGSAGSTAAPTVNWHGSTVTYALTNASDLPAGITINTTTGVVSWPSTLAVGTYTIKARGQNAVGFSNEASFELNIRPLVPSTFSYNSPIEAPFGTAGSAAVATAPNWNGETGTFSIGNPADISSGITINPTTGAISWTNSVPVNSWPVQVVATNSRGSQSITVTLNIYSEPPTNFSYAPSTTYSADYGMAGTIPDLPVINWHGHIGTYSISSVSPLPAAGLVSINAADGKINWTANLAAGFYTVTVRATNNKGSITTTYTLNIKPTAPELPVYTPPSKGAITGTAGASEAPVVSNWNGETGTFELSGTYPAAITLDPATGIVSWSNTLAVGTYAVKVRAKNSIGSSAEGTFTININASAPTEFYYNDNGETAIFTEAGNSRNPVVSLGGGSGTYTIETPAVSPEISINSTTGVISWTGSLAIGSYPFTVKVTNGVGSLTTPFTLNVVKGAPTGLSYTPNSASIALGAVGSSATPAIKWRGEVGTFSISGAPTGVTINTTSGVISWDNTVPAGAPYVLTVSAANSQAPAATATYTLIINGQAPTDLKYDPDHINTDAGVAGQSDKPTVNWHSDKGSFEVVNKASLPAGISVDAVEGNILWTDDLLVGEYNIQIRAVNFTGSSNTFTYKLVVLPGRPTITYTPGFTAILTGGTGTSATPVIKWNSATSSGSIDEANKTYPAGLVSLDKTTGVLSFNAASITEPATYDILIAVANTESKQGFVTYKLIIGKVPSNLLYATKGYDMLEGSSLVSTTPTVNWNGVQGVFKLYGAPDGVTIDETTGVITFGPTVAAQLDPSDPPYTFTVKAESSLGSSNEETISLRVIAKADATITGGATICENAEANLTINLTGTAPFSFTYTDGTTNYTVEGITEKAFPLKVKPTTTTTYTVTSVSDANGNDNPVTAGSDKTTVTVLPAPEASIQPINPCLGGTATLTANAGTGYVYTWSNGGTGLTTTVNTSGDYTVTVTGSNSCATTSEPLTVKLNTIPTAKLNRPANTLICEGFSKPLTASGGSSYNWYRNGALVKDSTKFTYYPSAEGSYTVDAVSAEGCTTKAPEVVVLQYARKPKADFTYDTYCRDVDINFVNNSDEGGGEILYKWVFDADNASTEKEPVFAYSKAGAKTITLTATSKVCPDLSDIKTVNVTIQEPAPAQRYEAVNGINGRSVTLKAQAKGDTYLWTSKDGMNTGLSDANVEQPTLRITKGDEYTVKISTKAGCVTVDTQQVRIFAGAQIFVPKAFTPNNDGVNDKLYPIPVGIPQITYFRVFNRWGVLMYETKQAGTPGNGVGWDGMYKGKQQPFDTYTWVAEGIDLDGKPVRLSGNSVLLR
ncbi:hypothetical protein GCM10011379_22720 [Filimonas zeae]|uniref:PKD domain-containing protein n=2 Tax=Filimonas zeae TaxID=1737353 RepID=A0A917IZ71_9BACT|nr:hypothetical protein GCM10011379_22720 [Filimonas zeae]